MSDLQFYNNLAVMCSLYVIAAFMFWLLDFQLEYLGSNLYLNFYLAGLVMILSAPSAISLYPKLGLHTLLQAMSIMMIPAFVFIVAVSKKWLVF